MGYPGDEGGGPPDSRLDARTRRAALSIPPRGPAAPGEEEPGGAVGRRRAPAARSAGPAADSPAPPGYGGSSGYGGETSYPGGSSGSHRRPDGPASYPGPTAGPAPAGYAAAAPGGTGYPPADQGTGRPPATPGTGYPAATQGTGRPPAAPGTGYPPATRETGSGRAAGRRRREHSEGREPSRGAAQPASAPATTGGPPSRENAWRRPERRPGQEIQGAPGNGSGSGGSQPRGSLWSAGAFRTAGPGGRGPLRGFPPAPGAPDPVYPPGQFSPWNAPELRAISAAGRSGLTAGSGPEISEPGYPLLAVSDPSADATATQTWAVLDDAQLAGLDGAQLAGEWTTASPGAPARSGRDENGHPRDGEGPQTGPRGFFESADGPETPAGSAAPGLTAPGLTGPDSRRPDSRHRDSQHRPDPAHRRATRASRGTGTRPAPGTPARLVFPVRPASPGRRVFPAALNIPAALKILAARGSRARRIRRCARPGRADGWRPASRRRAVRSNPVRSKPDRSRASRKPWTQTRAGLDPGGPGRRPAAASPANHASRPAGPGCGSCRWS